MKILMLIAVMLFADGAYAQDITSSTTISPDAGPSTTNVRPQRLLSMFLCGGTGNLNPDTDTVLDAWGQYGFTFVQGFDSTQWVTVFSCIAMCTAATGLNPHENGSANAFEPLTAYGYVQVGIGNQYWDCGFQYFNIGYHSDARFNFLACYYTMVTDDINVGFTARIDIAPFSQTLYATYDQDGGVDTSYYIRHLYLQGGLTYTINNIWWLQSVLGFRFNGDATDDYAADTAGALWQNFKIRWDNTVYMNLPSGFAMYGTLRYEPTNLYAKVEHNVSLMGGISYYFNMGPQLGGAVSASDELR